MSRSHPPSLQTIRKGQRDLRLVMTLVILSLAGGLALLWPTVEDAVTHKFGPKIPGIVILADLVGLVLFLVLYLWLKGRQMERVTRELFSERGVSQGLQGRLAQARTVLEASANMQMDEGTDESLKIILEGVTEALSGDRGVLYRVGAEDQIERESAFPSSAQAPDPEAIAFEDEIARYVIASGQTLSLDEDADLSNYGLLCAWPGRGYRSVIATPLRLDQPEGALLIRNVGDSAHHGISAEERELLEIFAGFSAGILRNLKVFQDVSHRNHTLDQEHQAFLRHQREIVEIETITSMGTIAGSLAHALSGPLTAISGFADTLFHTDPGSRDSHQSRQGLHREIHNFRNRLQGLVDFISNYRTHYDLVNLGDQLSCAANLRRDSMRARGLSLRYAPAANLPLTMCDPLRIRQVYLSFLDFIEAAVKQGTEHTVHARTIPYSGQIRTQFAFVAPQGILDLIPQLINPNVELSPVHREHGLSLAVASGIVRAHQGEISVEMLEDQRLLLTMDLPIRQDRPPTPEATFEVAPDLEASGLTSMERAIQDIFGPDDENPAPVEPPPARAIAPGPPPAEPAQPTPPAEPLLAAQDPEPLAAPTEPVAPAAENPSPEPPVEPASPAAAESGPAPASPSAGPQGDGLDEIFGPGDLWNAGSDEPAPVKPPPPRTQRRESAPLLDPDELEDALKLFDETEDSP